jgi:alkyldihydroxyacetonephosphate synthase
LFSERWMPNFAKWAEEFAHIDFSKKTEKQTDMTIHAPHFNHAFLEELGEKGFSRRSFFKWERIMHSHGATLQEVFILRHGNFKRVADVVIYPESNE